MTGTEKYEADAFDNKWRGVKRTGRFTVGTLIMHAKRDRPAEYAAMFQAARPHVRVRLNAGDGAGDSSGEENEEIVLGDIATLYMHAKGPCATSSFADIASDMLGSRKHVFVGPDKKNWYACVKGIWRSDSSAMTLREKVKRRVRQAVLDERARQEDIACGLPDAEKQAIYRKERVAPLWVIAQQLLNTRVVDDVISEMRNRYYREAFESLLDAKRGILPFTDGVYDFGANAFRPYRPDDYVTQTVGYAHADMMSTEVAEVVGVVDRIFADNREKLAMLRVIIGNACDGNNKRESLDLWIGDKGANGKTTVLDVIKAAFGRLAISLSGDALTKDADLNPQISRFQGMRFAVISEPDGKLEFNAALVKKLTGNDIICVRSLFKMPREFRASANIVVVCNALPTMSQVDNGVRRRIKVMEFNQCFKAEPDPEKPNEQLADDDLKDRIDADPVKFGMALMRWAMELRTSDEWNTARRVVPACCRVATEEYLNEADPYARTMGEYVVTRERTDYVLATDMYITYQTAGGRDSQTAFGRTIAKRLEGSGVAKARREGKMAWLGMNRVAAEVD